MQKIKKLWLKLLLILIVFSFSCKRHKPPKVALCGWAEKDKVLSCNDQRLPKGQNTIYRPMKNGDLCTNPQDFKTFRSYVVDLRSKLIKCENKLNNSRRR